MSFLFAFWLFGGKSPGKQREEKRKKRQKSLRKWETKIGFEGLICSDKPVLQEKVFWLAFGVSPPGC